MDRLDEILGYIEKKYGSKLLNDLPEFDKLEPTVENFSKKVFEEINSKLKFSNINSIEVKTWEEKNAYASYQGRIKR